MALRVKIQSAKIKKAITYITSVTSESLVLMTANNGKIFFEGTSTGSYVRVVYVVDSSDIYGQGIVSLDGQHLAGLKFVADPILYEDTDAKVLRFDAGSLHGNIPLVHGGGGIAANRPQPVDAGDWVTLPRDLLTAAIQAAVFEPAVKSASDGICIQVGPHGLTMYASDSVRSSLFVHDCKVDGAVLPATTVETVVSPRFFDFLRKVPGDGPVRIYFGNQVHVDTDAAYLTHAALRVHVDDVPERVAELASLPVEGHFGIHAKRLAEIVTTLASVVRGGIDHAHRFQFDVAKTASGSTLTMSLPTASGAMKDTVQLEGDVIPCSFKLSGKYLVDFLALLSGDTQISSYGNFIRIITSDGHGTLLLSTAAN